MSRGFIKIFIICSTLLGLPMLGVIITGAPATRYLEFPPQTQYVKKAAFSMPFFILLAILIFLVLTPFVYRIFRTIKQNQTIHRSTRPFPWWGWLGIMGVIGAWILAWTRFEWSSVLQPHTFPMIWFPLILVFNALQYKKTGGCLITARTRFFLTLFPLSALFWWFFEYLNRFVQNWTYSGTQYGRWQYFWLATLSFSTVLPAVLSVSDWLLSCSWVDKGFRRFITIKWQYTRTIALFVLAVSAISLFCIGIIPNFLFPMMWVSPLLIIVSTQVLFGEAHVLQGIAEGDWRIVVSAALAALICGFFWEMWNINSLSKWEYAIPFVHRFQIFEMPILGYSGYLPFGLECMAVSLFLAAKPFSEKRSI